MSQSPLDAVTDTTRTKETASFESRSLHTSPGTLPLGKNIVKLTKRVDPLTCKDGGANPSFKMEVKWVVG